jgi:hypothetical protein
MKVINIGLRSFKESLDAAGTAAVHVDWRAPAEVRPDLLALARSRRGVIEKANERAVRILREGAPRLVGLERAIDVVPGMRRRMILHAGPPIEWARMCGPMRGAIIGALLYERLASSRREAAALAASGAIAYSPCHAHGAVGPMAGVLSASMPVFLVRNEARGNVAFSSMNEGLGRVLRYGAYDRTVIARLGWMERVLFPGLRRAVAELGSVDLRAIIAQALHMGDELHNRNRAATSLFYRAIAPALVTTAPDAGTAAEILSFIHQNDHFFLNLSMAASKATLDAARGIARCGIVVAMARNGTDFGVQLSGTGERWFTGPAEVPDALFFPGYGRADANPDIGDSAITETNGLGGFAIAAAPAIVQFVGGSASDAVRTTLSMYEITASENPAYQIPALGFRGTPTGIDILRVIEKNTFPFIDTGVAHKRPGVGQIGAGVLRAPALPFRKAFEGFARTFQRAVKEKHG